MYFLCYMFRENRKCVLSTLSFRSLTQIVYYVGLTENVRQRLGHHNQGIVRSTARFRPWRLRNRDLLHQLDPCRRFRAVPENWLGNRVSSKAVSMTSFQAPRLRTISAQKRRSEILEGPAIALMRKLKPRISDEFSLGTRFFLPTLHQLC
jgi:GIY-YIG catalytic domain